MDITHITSLLGGVALFLYGMSIMGAGLEKLAGGKMQGVLQKLTSSTIKGVIFGTLITGVIQSSAGTVVICVGLVNSGIMTLTQSVGVIMGANIGTTVTGQLIWNWKKNWISRFGRWNPPIRAMMNTAISWTRSAMTRIS